MEDLPVSDEFELIQSVAPPPPTAAATVAPTPKKAPRATAPTATTRPVQAKKHGGVANGHGKASSKVVSSVMPEPAEMEEKSSSKSSAMTLHDDDDLMKAMLGESNGVATMSDESSGAVHPPSADTDNGSRPQHQRQTSSLMAVQASTMMSSLVASSSSSSSSGKTADFLPPLVVRVLSDVHAKFAPLLKSDAARGQLVQARDAAIQSCNMQVSSAFFSESHGSLRDMASLMERISDTYACVCKLATETRWTNEVRSAATKIGWIWESSARLSTTGKTAYAADRILYDFVKMI